MEGKMRKLRVYEGAACMLSVTWVQIDVFKHMWSPVHSCQHRLLQNDEPVRVQNDVKGAYFSLWCQQTVAPCICPQRTCKAAGLLRLWAWMFNNPSWRAAITVWQDQSASFDGKEAVAQSRDKTRSYGKLVNRGGDFTVGRSFIRTRQYSLVKRKSKNSTAGFFSLFLTGFGKIQRVATHVSPLPPSGRLALLLHLASKGWQQANLTGPL